jgi:hypothetical protein
MGHAGTLGSGSRALRAPQAVARGTVGRTLAAWNVKPNVLHEVAAPARNCACHSNEHVISFT